MGGNGFKSVGVNLAEKRHDVAGLGIQSRGAKELSLDLGISRTTSKGHGHISAPHDRIPFLWLSSFLLP